MDLSRKEMLQLVSVVAVAASFSWLLQTHRSLGENVSNNSLALAVRTSTSVTQMAIGLLDLPYRLPWSL